MIKKTRNVISSSKHEATVARYMKEVRDMQAAGITRRDLFKMGLTSSVGGLAAIGGASFMPNLAQAANSSGLVISPACTLPWSEPLVIPGVLQSVASFVGPQAGKLPTTETIEKFNSGCGLSGDLEHYTDARKEPFQRWEELDGANATKYELECCEFDWNFYCDEEYPTFNSKVWGYRDLSSPCIGLNRLNAYYGQPVVMRMYNSLPMQDTNGQGGDNQGFGINQISPHCHNLHNPPESDGGPDRFFDSSQFYDYFYPMQRAGFASTHILGSANNKPYIDNLGKAHYCPGDWTETQSSLWFHDHRHDFTSQNVMKGMASFYSAFSNDINLDTDDETTGLRLPSGKYDIPMVIGDKTFDQNGQMFMDTFNAGGFKGDQITVNFKIKPYLDVERRKYRFRILCGGPSTFIELVLKQAATNNKLSASVSGALTRIANDGNLMPKAQVVNSVRLGVAERADIIIDFSQYKKGDIIYLHNVLESKAPSQGTTGKILPFNDSTAVLKFIVGDLPVTPDYSGGGNTIYGHPTPGNSPAALKKLQTQKMVDFPVRPKPTVKRSFSFGSSNGAWNVNGDYYNPLVMSAYPAEGSCEEWEFKSPGGWSHPVHIHHEEGQVIKRDGKAPVIDDLSRKDVYRVGDGAVGSSNTGSLSFQMQFRDYYGDYVCHCHNVVHEDHGMMFKFKIVPPTDPKAGK
jgi:FtsP/CotA-like multicopper oxidase with cupredoxin domain